MEYLADTVTIIRYFSGDGKIGAQALEIMDEAEEGQHVRDIGVTRIFAGTNEIMKTIAARFMGL